MHMDPVMPTLVGALAAVLVVGLVLRRFRQPHVVAYLATGVAMGPHGLRLFTDPATLARLGEIGVVLLLFSVGMEVSMPRLLANWKVAVAGTALQVGLSVACVAGLGLWLDWPVPRIVLLGFVISLSSTAVAISMLRDAGRLESPLGRDALGILLVQDMAVVPMMIVLGLLAAETPSLLHLAVQAAGGAATLALIVFLVRRKHVNLPFGAWVRKDHELQVFAGLLACFGLAFATAALGLSSALGAFAGGILVATARETDWVHRSLEPFRVVLLAVFFVSIGMQIDLRFLAERALLLAALLLAVLLTNTLVNSGILRVLGRSWGQALHTGALLAPIGEFSFVLAAVGRQAGLVSSFGYQTALAVISISLLASPAWTALAARLARRDAQAG